MKILNLHKNDFRYDISGPKNFHLIAKEDDRIIAYGFRNWRDKEEVKRMDLTRVDHNAAYDTMKLLRTCFSILSQF